MPTATHATVLPPPTPIGTGFVDRALTWLGALPQVGFKVVELAVWDGATFALTVVLCFVKTSPIASSIYEFWLIFLASLHGINLGALGVGAAGKVIAARTAARNGGPSKAATKAAPITVPPTGVTVGS